jgi:hypothetical protein
MKNKLLLLAMGFALTTQMIIAQVPSYVPTNGLIAFYPFNGNANDESGNGNNGTFAGGSNLTANRYGNSNNAFQGGSSYVTCPSTVFQFGRTDNFSISIWYTKSLNDGGRMVSTENPEGNFRISKNGNVDLSVQYGDYLDFSITDNNWHNLIYTYFDRNEKVYIDGILTMTNYDNATELLNYGSPFTIGAKAAPGYDKWDGKIDDIGIWNRALTQEEITKLYYSDNTCQSLVINTGILGFNPVTYNNTVTIYPNPANDHITVDCGNLANVSGWTIKIVNTLGQEMFSGAMNKQQYTIPLNTWGGQGVYFVKIYDASNNLMNTKKIILQ